MKNFTYLFLASLFVLLPLVSIVGCGQPSTPTTPTSPSENLTQAPGENATSTLPAIGNQTAPPTSTPTPVPTLTPAPTPAPGPDNWVQVMSGGFGDRMNASISEFKVFRGHLYAATTPMETTTLNPPNGVPYSGATQVWHSADGQTWSQITSFDPSFLEPAKGIFWMETSGQDEEFLYVGGGGLYRSADGTRFQQINGPGSGFDLTIQTDIGALAVKETRGTKYLYAGTLNRRRLEIWRIPYDATLGWEKVLDFAAVDSTVKGVNYIYVWKDTIYVGTVGTEGSKIFQSSSGDPDTWTKNAGVGNGWGVPSNIDVAAMIEFNGFLYATTVNVNTGGQIWRTQNGRQWQQVVSNGLGSPKNQEPHRLAVAQGKLWVTFFSEAPMPSQVWRSDDGLHFVQSNLDGFGDPGITGGFPRIIEFKGTMYWGGSKPTAGAQIWRIGP